MQNNSIACNYCGEEIHTGSRRCPYCGSLLKVEFGEFPVSFPPAQTVAAVPDTRETGEMQQGDMPAQAHDSATENMKTQVQVSQAVFGPARPLPDAEKGDTAPLSNSKKVWLVVITTLIPGLGQLIGVIASVLYLNSLEEDRRTFGSSLLVASIVVFFLQLVYLMILLMGFAAVGA